MRTRLPDYMLPGSYVLLEQLPLTANGKVDKRALSAPEQSANFRQDYEPPQGFVEESIARIWCELLRIEKIGRHENFLEVGGHSLLVVQVVTRVGEELAVRLQIRDVFRAPTVAELAETIFSRQLEEFDLDDVRRISRELDQLSDDEIRKLADSTQIQD
jgi:hypothetical protein